MKKNQNLVWQNAMNYGAIGGISISLYRFLTYFGNATFGGASVLRWPILIVIIILGTKYLRDKILFGEIKYSEALGSGLLISIFSSIIFGFYVYIEFTYISPKLMEEFLILQEEAFMKMTFFSDDKLEEMITELHENASPFRFGMSEMFSTAFWGFIFSLITSIFLKKEKSFINTEPSE